MFARQLPLMCLTLLLTACVKVEPGCGYGASDAALMARVKEEMRRQGIAYEELPNGMVQCRSADAERFHALIVSAEAAQLRSMTDDMAGKLAILADSPDDAACLSSELARRQISFTVGTLGGRQSVEWRPESEEMKNAVLAACKSKE